LNIPIVFQTKLKKPMIKPTPKNDADDDASIYNMDK